MSSSLSAAAAAGVTASDARVEAGGHIDKKIQIHDSFARTSSYCADAQSQQRPTSVRGWPTDPRRIGDTCGMQVQSRSWAAETGRMQGSMQSVQRQAAENSGGDFSKMQSTDIGRRKGKVHQSRSQTNCKSTQCIRLEQCGLQDKI